MNRAITWCEEEDDGEKVLLEREGEYKTAVDY